LNQKGSDVLGLQTWSVPDNKLLDTAAGQIHHP